MVSQSAFGEDFWIRQAIAEIADIYGVQTRISNRRVLKFGRNEDVDTAEVTVWLPDGHETYLTDNLITTLSSSNAGDDQLVSINGLTLSAGDFTNVTQTATVNGQNKVTLTTPLARSTRVRNMNSTNFAGDIYVYEDDDITAGVPDTATKIHAQCGADNQTLQCCTTIASTDYWAITQAYLGLNNKTAAGVEGKIQIRESGGVFRTQLSIAANPAAGAQPMPLTPCIIVPANADFRMTAISDTNNVSVSAWANGVLLEVI